MFIASQPFFALEHDNTTGILYAVDNTTRQLGTLDKTTAAFTPLFTLTGFLLAGTENVTGLAFNTWATGPVYLSAGNGTVTNIYTVNTATGAIEPSKTLTGFGQPYRLAMAKTARSR